jgi:hypothetical protein
VPDALTALAAAWTDPACPDRAATGVALHDCLEEAEWPLAWREEAPGERGIRHRLYIPGIVPWAASVWGYPRRPDLWGWVLRQLFWPFKGVEGTALSLVAAKAAAETALRNALRGG